MDIKHALNARATLTLGKDMVFRDLAQGAFRMRGIGEGQTVSILVIPEVQELMQRQLMKAGSTPAQSSPRDGLIAAPMGRSDQQRMLREVTAWLVINSMKTERVQFDQLCYQVRAPVNLMPPHTSTVGNLLHASGRPMSRVAPHSSLRCHDACAPARILPTSGDKTPSTSC